MNLEVYSIVLLIGLMITLASTDFLLVNVAYGKNRGIFLYDTLRSQWKTLASSVSGFKLDPIAVAYDTLSESVLFNDHDAQMVFAVSLNTMVLSVVYIFFEEGEKKIVDGMFMESTSRNLYLTESTKGTVARYNLETRKLETLWSRKKSSPRDIVVDSKRKIMFWTDWGSEHAVWSARDDGKDPRQLAPSHNWLIPNGMHYDANDQIIFVCELGLYGIPTTDIVAIDLTTNTTATMESFHGSHCYDLEGNATHLFMSDWSNSAIVSMPKKSVSSTRRLTTISNGRFFGLQYHSQLQEMIDELEKRIQKNPSSRKNTTSGEKEEL